VHPIKAIDKQVIAGGMSATTPAEAQIGTLQKRVVTVFKEVNRMQATQFAYDLLHMLQLF
jgi:hypothetical protein